MREQKKIPDAMFFNRIFERCMPKEELTKEEMSKGACEKISVN